MRTFKTYPLSGSLNLTDFSNWADKHFSVFSFLNSNGYAHDKYGTWNQMMALGDARKLKVGSDDCFSDLRKFSDEINDWLFGYLSYDLKNQLEELSSDNDDRLMFPLMEFFQPVVVILEKEDSFSIGCLPGHGNFSDPDWILSQIKEYSPEAIYKESIEPIAKVSRERYLTQVKGIKENIKLGNIYEMNYCIEFFAENVNLDTAYTYKKLNSVSPTPFSAFLKSDNNYLICASPERYMKKQGDVLICQPIKGTAKRSDNPQKDQRIKEQLYLDKKERSENVMIVDLVRNDLSRVAQKDSVKVTELFGIYSFSTVHQMISTVEARLKKSLHFTDALRQSFPMGSMTGAPKVKAMQLAEQFEDTKRGLYSGAVGYISPEKDFDFNVVIRSILYNREARYLSFMAGSAITSGSVPEKEYQECLHKAETMKSTLK